jgi:uncharacterized protein YcfJ
MRIAAILVAATMLSGCVTNQNAGAAFGGLAGGLLGSTVGGGSGRLVGTGVGAVLGTMIGGAIGESIDDQNRASYQPYHGRSDFHSSGEAAAYNRGRAERQAQIQAQREHNAYLRGYRGY